MKRRKKIGWIFCLLSVLCLWGCGTKLFTKQEEIKTFSAFVSVPGKEIPDDNRMKNKIAEKIGAKAELKYLTGQTASEKIHSMIQKGTYPDFLDGGDATAQLLEANAYIPLDEYLDDYPELKNYLTPEQWESLRQPDGHIYYIPQFSTVRGEDMNPRYADEAFWIQKRVLIWAGYPEIKTLDQYFRLIEDYMAANPTNEDGSANTGFQILCDDWRYFCLENPPQFLAGYPNDGCAIVDPETKTASVYDTIPEAKQYFQKLNEMYGKGMIQADTFVLSYDQYMEKISTGNVLGVVDQYWQFMDAENILYGKGLVDRTYVPLRIVADESITGAYRSGVAFNSANGMGITVSCKDVEGALQFMNDLLKEEIHIMRYWGEEGIDYEVDENGIFYRTEEQKQNANNKTWQTENLCSYDYFPKYGGVTADGKNAAIPEYQPGEYYDTLDEIDKQVLDGYGYEKWTDFLNSPEEITPPWFPLYTAENLWGQDTPYGQAKQAMSDVKHKWLPQVIMAEDFESAWESYMEEYEREVDVEAYEAELTREVQRRIENHTN